MDSGPQWSVTALDADAVDTVDGAADGPLVAGAPISWGICEVPGWEAMLPADLLLSQMHELGLIGTELGPTGLLPDEPEAVRAEVNADGLMLVGAFAPLALWSPDPEVSTVALADADLAAAKLAPGAGKGATPSDMPPKWGLLRPLGGRRRRCRRHARAASSARV